MLGSSRRAVFGWVSTIFFCMESVYRWYSERPVWTLLPADSGVDPVDSGVDPVDSGVDPVS